MSSRAPFVKPRVAIKGDQLRRYTARVKQVAAVEIRATTGCARHCVRVAMEMDQKSIGLCPQELESPRCRAHVVYCVSTVQVEVKLAPSSCAAPASLAALSTTCGETAIRLSK